MAVALFLCCLFFPHRSLPQTATDESAQDLYTKGAFQEAAVKAQSGERAFDLAFAARALLADVICSKPDPANVDVVLRAKMLAYRALEISPENVEAHVQAVIALGFEARQMGKWRAHFSGLGKQGKKLLQNAYILAPEDPWVLSAFGGWHLEIADKAGKRKAGWLYGAKVDEGIALFDEALRRAPHIISMRHQYALSLLALDTKRYREKVTTLLEHVAKMSASNYFETFSQKRSAQLLQVLKLNDRKALRDEVERQQTHFKKEKN